MNDTVIDFAQLRKMERLRLKKERLLTKQQQQQSKAILDKDEKIQPKEEQEEQETVIKAKIKMKQSITNSDAVEEWTKEEEKSSISDANKDVHHKWQSLPKCSTLELSKTTTAETDVGKYQVKTKNQKYEDCLKHVYYIPQCLTEEYTTSLSNWLHSLPKVSNDAYQINKKNNETVEEYFNGKWTRLKHAQRNVALLDLRLHYNQNKKTTSNNRTDIDVALIERLCHLLVYEIKAFPESHPPNHILMNEYQPMEGIMPHTDGPLYYHKTATFSIGGDVLLQFTKRQKEEYYRNSSSAQREEGKNQGNREKNENESVVMQIMLSGNGSLVIFDEDAYINHCHSINDRILNDMIEYAGPKCVNLEQGDIVRRGHRFSLTFRHKY